MLNTLYKFTLSFLTRIKKYWASFLVTPTIYDLTHPITPSTPVFPGDPSFTVDKVQSIEKGNSYNLCHLHFGNHMGTHIDFPAHVIKDGKTSSNYPIESFIGRGIIIEVPENSDNTQLGITQEFIQTQPIYPNDIVFFKTSNSQLPHHKISEKFVYLSASGANELVNKKVKIVGIDYLSIDSLDDEKLPVHHKLLENNILIVENLNLKRIPSGRYSDIAIIPPNIPDLDGLPIRAFARK